MCPGGLKTGGTELLHQLVCEIDRLGGTVFLVYIGSNLSTPQAFKKYINNNICEERHIVDDDDNIVIIPETYVEKMLDFKNIKRAIWWLSVDNYTRDCSFFARKEIYGIKNALHYLFAGKMKDTYDIIKCADVHFCQSFYSITYLKNLDIEAGKILYLSDYINDIYTENYVGIEKNERSNIVLYNPLKGKKYTQRLIKLSSELNWMPIQNMSDDSVRELLQRSKVYVDFGHHPGKDRFPREAAISGCCVITGKRGAANFFNDIPIPDRFKFDEKSVDANEIIRMIKLCLKEYETTIDEFEEYRNFIVKEKDEFIKSVNEYFIEKKCVK